MCYFLTIKKCILYFNLKMILLRNVLVDIAAKRVYWVDPKVDRVESIDYNGNDRRIVVQGMNKVSDILLDIHSVSYIYIIDNIFFKHDNISIDLDQ